MVYYDFMIYYSKANNLIIDYSKVLGYDCLLTLTSWEKGISWESFSDGERFFQKDYLDDPGITLHQIYDSHKANNWLRTIPEYLINKLLAYEKCYQLPIYPLLYLLSRYKCSIDLFKSNQNLMAIIMYSAKTKNWNEEYVTNLLNRKRIDILNACGFPRKKSIIKTLNNLRVSTLTYQKYCTMKTVLLLPNIHLINHLNYIDINLLELIEKNTELLSSPIIRGYHKEWPIAQFKRLYIDTNRMLGPEGYQRLLNCRTIDEIEKLHEKCIIKINKEKKKKLIVFPSPPIQGNKDIIPLTNSYELINEGIIQHHCVVSYQNDIICGNSYIYKVLEPERATLEVTILANAKFQIAQLRLSCNQSPSKETIQKVDKWIREASTLLKEINL